VAPPVNFENLTNITGGDKEIEESLLNCFLSSSAECIEELRAALASNNDGTWEKSAHAMAGISLNLGATHLGTLCKQAQHGQALPSDEKAKVLADIEREWVCVCHVIETKLGPHA